MRCWIKDHPISAKRLKGHTPAKSILDIAPCFTADFTLHPEANPKSRKDGLVRYQKNPQPDWGPKPRATLGDGCSLEKRRQKGMEKAQERRATKRLRDDTRNEGNPEEMQT